MTFKHYPPTSVCPICGTSNDSECLLIPIDGTQEGNNEQAVPVHTKCLFSLPYRYQKKMDIFYAFGGNHDTN